MGESSERVSVDQSVTSLLDWVPQYLINGLLLRNGRNLNINTRHCDKPILRHIKILTPPACTPEYADGINRPGDLESRLDGRRKLCLSFCPVSNAANNAGQNQSAKAATLPFEEALKKLESIVETMESGDLPLESLLAKYEEGTHLARICQTKLAEAELKIQQLEKNAAGEMKLESLSPEASERQL